MIYSDNIYRAVEKLHWLQIAEDGVLEIYLDNHTLQTFRMCEARFMEEFVEGYSGKGGFWFLDFGICVHKAIENYYIERKRAEFNLQKWALIDSKEIWLSKDMDATWSQHPDYIKLGGFLGFSALLFQYAQYFNIDNDRFRVIGTELYFGKNKEVPLLQNKSLYSFAPFRLYLSGKIDLLVDDGYNIGPMDHKTAKDFRGQNLAQNYEIQDGMTGYVFAAREIVKQFQDKVQVTRSVNKIWMNFLQVKTEKNMEDRFKRIPLFKSDWELEQYRLRQISTASRIYQLIENPNLQPYYNTMACTNYMHNQCPFLSAHKQKDKESQLAILNADFVKGKIWDPETVKD